MASFVTKALSAARFAADRAYLVELGLRGVRVGQRVEVVGRPLIYNTHGGHIVLGEDVRLWSRDSAYICHNQPVRLFASSREARIEIGARTRLNGASIAATELVRVGEDCYLAAGTTIIDSDGHAQDAEMRASGKRDEPRPVVIGNRVWTGLRVLILKGVTIGDDTIVGAGSVVTRSLPPRTLCAGNPARVVRAV